MILIIAIVELTNVTSKIRMHCSVTRLVQLIMSGEHQFSFLFGSMNRILFGV